MNPNSAGSRTSTAGDCRRVRERLYAPATAKDAPAGTPAGIAGTPAAGGPLAAHLGSCPECAAFARRLQLARQELGRPQSAVEPDPYFPVRVLARIARPAELIGWAAFRALPAALGLALALAWLGLSQAPVPPPLPPPAAASPLLDEPPSSDQLLAWSSLSPEVWP